MGSVEAFDVRILVRFARLDVLDGHAGILRPAGECLAEELRAVDVSQDLGQAMFSLQSLRDPKQAH